MAAALVLLILVGIIVGFADLALLVVRLPENRLVGVCRPDPVA